MGNNYEDPLIKPVPAQLFFRRGRRAFFFMAASVTAALMTACGGGGGGASETSATFPVQVTDARVQAGTSLYANNCASCHGTPGVSRPTLPTAPPHDDQGHTWHHADRMLFDWVLDRPPLATVMPAFRGQLSEDEVLSILAYIKSTWPADVQQFQNEGSAQYELQLKNSGSPR
jgi:mono/diheme cytochrome c family protein